MTAAKPVGACGGCGAEEPLKRGLCPGCQLHGRVDQLRRSATPERAQRLAPYLDALARSANPASTLRWMQTPPFANLQALVEGEVAVSHPGLDELVDRGASLQAVRLLRAALVEHQVLERRDEASADFARWLRGPLDELPDGPDRAQVRAFAVWHVAHRLAHTSQTGLAGPSPRKYARTQVRRAIDLVLWLHAQDLTLSDLRQDHLDAWLAGASSTRRVIRIIPQWLARRDMAGGALHAAWPIQRTIAAPLDDAARLGLLQRLLENGRVDARDRFAGALVLLFGQPLTRIVGLRHDDVTEHSDGRIALRLGRGPVELPAPVAGLAVALRDRPHGRRRGAAAGGDWLLPGYVHGRPITAEAMRARLRRHGITATRPGRHGALLALAGQLPAPVLAERLGLHHRRAAEWTRVAGAPYAEYVAVLTHAPAPASSR